MARSLSWAGTAANRSTAWLVPSPIRLPNEMLPWSVGGAVIGVTKSFSDNNGSSGGPMQPGYVYENAFLSCEVLHNLTLTLGVNNLGNTIGITEIDSGRSGPGGTAISARSIAGRTTSLTLKYEF